MKRHHLKLTGRVQGIGFRPFVYRLAMEMGLFGRVHNDTEGVHIELDANPEQLQEFLRRLQNEKPPLCEIRSLIVNDVSKIETPYFDFSIRSSHLAKSFEAEVLPDLATCQECQNEIFDPTNRRYRYFFTNCTYCGPRFSIIKDIPYDRRQTTMASFQQCSVCLSEYQWPRDRRFHAQPNACGTCGPEIALYDEGGKLLLQGFPSLEKMVEAVLEGQIVAMKGLGGYQLIADATNPLAVDTLRVRKRRRRKPFAVMMTNLKEIQDFCHISPLEEELLISPAAPIVLLQRRSQKGSLSEGVAPNNSHLGVFLPNTPLHHWLVALAQRPLIVTSANVSDEPLVFTEPDVFMRLHGIADCFLGHNRPIERPIDDSVVQVVENRVFVLRLARGYAPTTLPRPSIFKGLPQKVLAVGGHMKNSFCLGLSEKLILGPYLGDLESDRTQNLFETELREVCRFYHFEPEVLVHDFHPGYFSTEWAQSEAQQKGLKAKAIQHHRAHIYSVLAEQSVEGPFLGVAWDGTGFGDDGTIWGGEVFFGDSDQRSLPRVASLRPFRLLGGEAAVREPWRVALSLLLEVDQEMAKKWMMNHWKQFGIPGDGQKEFALLTRAWQENINAPLCSSLGRFLEGVSALLNLTRENEFEADAAMQLEFQATLLSGKTYEGPPLAWKESSNNIYLLDWGPWIRSTTERLLLRDERAPAVVEEKISSLDLASMGLPRGPHGEAADIHFQLVERLLELALRLEIKQLVLSGGVFQNRFLVRQILGRASELGLKIILPQRVPLNDGGIALGQLYGALWSMKDRME